MSLRSFGTQRFMLWDGLGPLLGPWLRRLARRACGHRFGKRLTLRAISVDLSLIHISEPTRPEPI
eukprot:5390713-Pyramimonas_sp.AAC.1